MLKHVKEYLKSLDYEILIRRAFHYSKDHPRIGNWGDNVDTVRRKLLDALDQFIQSYVFQEVHFDLIRLKAKLLRTYEKEDLYLIIVKALELTRNRKVW